MKVKLLFQLLLIALLFVNHPVAAQWTQLTTGASGNLFSTDYLNSGHIWIGGESAILHSSNNGNAFTIQSPVDQNTSAQILGDFRTIHATSGTSAVASGAFYLFNDLFIYSTANSGSSWSWLYQTSSGNWPRAINAMAFNGTGSIVAVGSNGKLLQSGNNGSSWSVIFNSGVDIMDVAWAGGTSFVAITASNIYRSFNNGISFINLALPGTGYLKISFDPVSGTGYLLHNQEIRKSTDYGQSWTTVGSIDDNLTSVYCVSPDTLFVGATGDLYRSVNGGVTWESFKLPGHEKINMIQFYDQNHGVAVGDSGYAVLTSNAGGAAYPLAAFSIPAGPYCEASSIQPVAVINPSWTIEWLLNGVVVSTALNPSIPLSVPGNANLTLVVNNGIYSDTLTKNIVVTPLADALPFIWQRDTSCLNTPGSFTIFNSQVNANYQILDGSTVLGSKVGTGDTITISTTANQSLVKPLRIKSTITTLCGTDTLSVIDSLYIIIPRPNVTAQLYRDTVCVNDTTTMLVFNTEPGWEYFLNAYPAVKIAGNGGTIQIPVPAISNNTTHAVYGVIPGYNCPRLVTTGLVLVFRNAFASIMPTTLQTGISQPVSVSVNAGFYNVFNWDFGPNATPSTATGQFPPAVSFSTQGVDTITLYAQLNNTCWLTVKKPMNIYGVPVVSGMDTCSIDSGKWTRQIVTDRLILDDYNNVLMSGYEMLGGPSPLFGNIMRNDSAMGRAVEIFLTGEGYSTATVNGMAGDRLNNTYLGAHFVAQRWGEIADNAVKNPNAVAKINGAGKFQWAIETPYIEVSDVQVTNNDNHIYVLGSRAYNGFEISTPQGVYAHPANVNNKGDGFILELDPEGTVLSSIVFGGRGVNGLDSPAPLNPKYKVNNAAVDTLRHNLQMREMPGGGFKICGLLTATTSTLPIYFANDQLQNVTSTSSTNYSLLFLTNWDKTSGFTQSKVVLSGGPRYITDFVLDASGNTYIAGKAFTRIGSLGQSINLLPTNSEYQFLSKVDPNGNVNWIITADSMEFRSLCLNSDGSISIAAYLTTKYLLVDAANIPHNLSPSKVTGTYLMKFSPDGELLNGDFLMYAKAFGVKTDACGNYHAFFPYFGMGGQIMRTLRKVYSVNGSCSNSTCYSAYDPANKDVGIVSFALSDTTAAGPATRSLNLDIVNRGTVPVSNVVFNYHLNKGSVQQIPWNGSVLPGDTIGIALGNISFTRSFNKLEGWITTVNGTVDDEQANDSALIRQTVCMGGLNGTYSLGCDTCYFETFTSAANSLMRCGVSGPVKIVAQPGTYHDQVQIDTIQGISAVDSVLFTSATGDPESVILEFRSNYYTDHFTVCLDRASYVSFSNMSIYYTRPYNSLYNYAYLKHHCAISLGFSKGNRIINCHIRAAERKNTTSLGLYAGDVHDFIFSNNTVFDNRIDITVGDNLIFTNNIINNCKDFRIDDIKRLKFNNNSVTSSTGVKIYYTDTLEVSGNFISLESVKGTALDLMQSNGAPGQYATISNNILGNIYDLYPFTPSLSVNGEYLNIYNNSLSSGVYFYSTDSVNFKNNLVRSNIDYVVKTNSNDPQSMDYNRFQSANGLPLNFIWNSTSNLTFSGWKSATGHDLNSDSITVSCLTTTDMHLTQAAVMPGIPLGILTDIDGDLRSATNPTIGADEFTSAPIMINVWPGDCDSTKNVDNYDLIPVGLYLNRYGNSRPINSLTWTSHPIEPWTVSQVSGINMSHADADGNGVVNLKDTLPVMQNFGMAHAFAPPAHQRPVTGPEIALVPVGNNFNDGDTVRLNVMVGTAQNPVTDLAALGFQVQLPLSLMQSGSFEVVKDSTFLCPDKNCISYSNADPLTGLAAFTIVRTDKIGVSGTGRVGQISFVKDAGWNGGTPVTIGFTNFKGYEPTAIDLPLTGVPAVLSVSVGLINIEGRTGLTVYPNPVHSQLNLLYNWKGNSEKAVITLYDLSGKTVLKMPNHVHYTGQNEFSLDISQVQPGMYLLEISSSGGRMLQRVVKQ